MSLSGGLQWGRDPDGRGQVNLLLSYWRKICTLQWGRDPDGRGQRITHAYKQHASPEGFNGAATLTVADSSQLRSVVLPPCFRFNGAATLTVADRCSTAALSATARRFNGAATLTVADRLTLWLPWNPRCDG